MKFTPHPFQKAGIDHAIDFLSTASVGAKQLYAAPTGCGKSVVELLIQEAIPDSWIVTPREEIIYGMLDKLEVPEEHRNFEVAYALRICTPIRLRNRLMRGEGDVPKAIIWDECHHQTAESYQQLELLSGIAPSVGFTATPYRGSPRSTREFREQWGEPLWLITYPEAEQMGYVSMPKYEMLPLLDDDEIELRNGEFEVTCVEDATKDRLDVLLDHLPKYWDGSRWDVPTIFACPGSRICAILQSRMQDRGMLAYAVTANTPKSLRQDMFRHVVECKAALIHVNIVTEGVDLPLRRLIDLSPVMSPVKWLQQLGRITRPNGSPLYVCTNRNLLRHAYLLEGCIPADTLPAAEKVFGVSFRSSGARMVGLEAIGRFKPTTVKTTDGVSCTMFNLHVVTPTDVVEYCALAHPAKEVRWFCKVNGVKADGTKDWGKWVQTSAPEDLKGFASRGEKELSDAQRRWWNRQARFVGLDPDQPVNRKNFCALPVLVNTGVRI